MRRSGAYLIVVLALWVFMPELRRLIDWRVGFQAINVLSVVPLAALIPLAVGALRRWSAVPAAMRIVAWLWLGAFAYGLVVAVTSGSAPAGAYTFAQFTLPLAAGLWASTIADPQNAYRRFAVAAVAFGAVSSLYAIVEYVALPPWDAYWMQNADIGSMGQPLPYQVRVFGTLNAPGPFADFAMIALLLAAGAGMRPLRATLNVAVIVAAFALSSVRSAWVACVLGLATYVALSPRPLRTIAALGAVAAVAGAVVVSLPAIVGDAHVNDALAQRASTLQDVGADESANDRERQIRDAWSDVQARPLGSGLGTVGTATKLSTATQTATTLDSGYLSRLVEMGFPGFAGYVAAIAVALGVTLRTLFSARDPRTRTLAATSAAIQVALIGMDFSGEGHPGVLGMAAWTLAGLAAAAHGRREAEAPRRAPARLQAAA